MVKFLICDKGGCKNNSIATFLAKSLVKKGKLVLVIATDESNFGLHRQLGGDLPFDFTNYFGDKATVLEK